MTCRIFSFALAFLGLSAWAQNIYHGTFVGDGSSVTNATGTNLMVLANNPKVLVVSGFGPGLVTVTNDHNGTYIPGPTIDGTFLNNFYYWNETSSSFTNANGVGVYNDVVNSATSWITNAAFPLTLDLVNGLGSGMSAGGSGYVSYWYDGNNNQLPNAISKYATNSAPLFSIPYLANTPAVVVNANVTMNGAGVTNLYGYNIQDGTVPLSKVQIGGSGSVTNNGQTLTNLQASGWINNFQRTPPLFVNSLPTYGIDMTEANVLNELAVLKKYTTNGWNIIQWDEGWEGPTRVNGDLTWSNTLVPDGIPYLAQQCHAVGVHLQLYTSMSSVCCAGRPGSEMFNAYRDTQKILSWGCDGWKLDHCNAQYTWPQYLQFLSIVNQAVNDWFNTWTYPDISTRGQPYFCIHFPSVYDGTLAVKMPMLMQGAQVVEDMWWGDTTDGYLPDSHTSDGLWQSVHLKYHTRTMTSPGHYVAPLNLWFNAPNGGSHGGWGSNPWVTNWINSAIMLASPFQLDSAIAADANMPGLLGNMELWSIENDDAVIPADIVWTNGIAATPAEIWQRYLGGRNSNQRAIMFINSNTVPVSITCNSTILHDPSGTIYSLRDPWGHVNLGKFTDTFSFTIQPTNTYMIRLKATPPLEQQ